MESTRETSILVAAHKVQGTDVFNIGGDRIGSIHELMIDKQSGQIAYVRIPRQSGRGFRFDVGHHSEMKPATIPK